MDRTLLSYLFYGYAVAWLMVTALILYLVSREKGLRREMESLRRLMDERKVLR